MIIMKTERVVFVLYKRWPLSHHDVKMFPYDLFCQPNFLSKKSHGNEGVTTYANLTCWKNAVTYLDMDGRTLILTLLLNPSVTETDPDEDSCV